MVDESNGVTGAEGSGDLEGAAEGSDPELLLGDKHMELLPTPTLSSAEFEDFTEMLLRAHRFCSDEIRHVVRVARWGRPGDKQDGIDFEGDMSGAASAAWQCKRLDSLPPATVRDAVRATTFEADEFYLVYSGEASAAARKEIAKYERWALLDRRDLTEMLRDLPLHRQRDVLDQTWGKKVRRLFLENPGEDAFASIETFAADRRNPDMLLNDTTPLVGREAELAALGAALDRSKGEFPKVVVVTGPGGRGKSRLVTEVLSAVQAQQRSVPVVCLTPGWTVDTSALGELQPGPAVIFVDDAHLDPDALAPLLSYVRQQKGAQLVVATRPSALTAVTTQVALARFGPSHWVTISVEELTLPEARRLVSQLTDGLGLAYALRAYLAAQATHSPHVAVITANLIRRGELTASLAVDDGLRDQVLARYQEVLAPRVDGVDGAATRRVLATCSALGPVSLNDAELRERLATFCGLGTVELLRALKGLRDRGVLVAQNDSLRVVPDILGDHVLEVVAAVEGINTGFVDDLWATFERTHHHQLVRSLGELDWRLARRGGPRVTEPVWSAVRDRLKTHSFSRLCKDLEQLDELAATQPRELVAALEELRERLNQHGQVDDLGRGAREPNTATQDDEDENDAATYRGLFGLPPLGPDDVRRRMPKLYARAAANEPDLLETALDALWDLRRRDRRETNPNPDHAERVIVDKLGNLAALPDRSFPMRIVARVREWLQERSVGDDAATPLFALKPLISKEALHTYSEGPNQLTLQRYSVSPEAMAPVRDKIRDLLLQEALSNDLQRASEAINLLAEALRQPHGYFGHEIGDDAILAWEEDDLATLSVLEQVATSTAIPTVRRRIRDQIAWSAEHASSVRVQHSALALVLQLDSIDSLKDDLADLLLHNRFRLPRSHGQGAPTIEELEAERAAERERVAGFSKEQLQNDRNARIREKVQSKRELDRQYEVVVARRLLGVRPVPEMLDILDETTRAVRLVASERLISLWGLWNQLSALAPEFLGDIVRGIADREPGLLDQQLDLLIDRWFQHAPTEATAWLGQTHNRRAGIKIAVANGFSNHNWHELGEPFPTIYTTGINDPAPDIRAAFLSAGGPLLRVQPAAAVQVFLYHDISPAAAERVLDEACSYLGQRFGAALNVEDAEAVLRLVARAGYHSYAVQEIVAGIATTHPYLVLDHLAERDAAGEPMPRDISNLGHAFDNDPEALAAWARRALSSGTQAGRVISAALNDQLTNRQAEELGKLLPDLDADQLRAFTNLLGSIDTWALRQPALAAAVAERARATNTFDDIRARLKTTMHPRHWSGVNGVSTELNNARDHAKRAADATTDDDLRADYEEAHEHIEASINADLSRNRDDEEGW